MHIVLFGAGKMAHAITHDLLAQPDITRITIADIDLKNAKRLQKKFSSKKVRAVEVDATHAKSVKKVIADAACAIGATTYAHNPLLTKACIQSGVHFCDLGGNIDVVQEQYTMNAAAKKSRVTILPDCGLAPGMSHLLGYHYAQSFDSVDHLQLRVGGLPQNPNNRLKYQLAFSVEGLINEYIEEADVIVNRKTQRVPGMSHLESLHFAPPYTNLEAFVTSGGTSTLPQTLAGKVNNLDYKTIRYEGHAQFIQLFMEMGLTSSEPRKIYKQKIVPRRILAQLLSDYLPSGEPDVVLIRIRLVGSKGGRPVTEQYDCIDYYDPHTGLSAMQRTTGFSVAILAHMLARGTINKFGVLQQEKVVDGAIFLRALAARGIRFTSSAIAADTVLKLPEHRE